MNNVYATAGVFSAPVNPLFLQSALCALSKTQLMRLPDTPAFNTWPETSKSLVLEEIRVRTDGMGRRVPPANPLAA